MPLYTHTFDCAAGEMVVREMTPEEEAAHAAAQADAQAVDAGRQAAADQRAADLASVKAHAGAHPDDPAWQAIGRLVGAL